MRYGNFSSVVSGRPEFELNIRGEPHTIEVAVKYLKLMSEICPSLCQKFVHQLNANKIDAYSISQWKTLFNQQTKAMRDAKTPLSGDWGNDQCTADIATIIITLAYEAAIPNPHVLNLHYAPGSSEVYGETMHDQVRSICDELQIGADDVFVDLGSGVGHLVCFVSAYSGCKKAAGIEAASLPAGYGDRLMRHFRTLMSHFDKSHGALQLHKGDFLHPRHRNLITNEATVIFINNLRFEETLNRRIQNELLENLSEDVKIVTTRPLGNLDPKRVINRRNVGSDFSSMCDTTRLISLPGGVSWTGKPVDFYLNRINRTKMQQYYDDLALQRGRKS